MNQNEWRNQASLANYPFASTASRVSSDGASTLRTEDIVDANLVARSSTESGFHISELTVSDESVSGVIFSDLGSFGTFSIQRSVLPSGTARITDSVGIDRGLIVFGQDTPDLLERLAVGRTLYDPEALAFHQGVVFHPAASRVATIRINDIPIYGRVRLKAGAGIRLGFLEEDGRDVVVIHAVGAPVEKNCGVGSPIKNFNSVPPNAYGTISLRPAPYMTPEGSASLRQLIRIKPSDDKHGIIISLSELSQ